MKPTIVSMTPLHDFVETWLDQQFKVLRYWQATDANTFFKEAAPVARAIATGFSRIDAPLLNQLPNVQIIASFGVGFDHIDILAAKERNIRVTNTPDVLTDDVADLAIGLLLSASRRIAEGDRFIREGQWLKGKLGLGKAIKGKTLGILGLGRIGQAIANRATAFGMTIIYHNRSQKTNIPWTYYADLTEMARHADFLAIATTGGAETHHLVSRQVLEALGAKGTLINISRGTVIDETALITALRNGHLGSAALDVFEQEPKVPEALLAMNNVVLSPHQASATVETRHAMGQLMIDNLLAYFKGEPLPTPVL